MCIPVLVRLHCVFFKIKFSGGLALVWGVLRFYSGILSDFRRLPSEQIGCLVSKCIGMSAPELVCHRKVPWRCDTLRCAMRDWILAREARSSDFKYRSLKCRLDRNCEPPCACAMRLRSPPRRATTVQLSAPNNYSSKVVLRRDAKTGWWNALLHDVIFLLLRESRLARTTCLWTWYPQQNYHTAKTMR